MPLDRRTLLAVTAATAGAGAASQAGAAPSKQTPTTLSALGIDASQFGVRPSTTRDQTRSLQRAIDQAASTGAPLALAPGLYRAGDLKLPRGAQLVGVPGATRLMLTEGPSLASAGGASNISITGLTLDGGKKPLPDRRGLLHIENGNDIRIRDCTITGAGNCGLYFVRVGGDVMDTTITDNRDIAIASFDATGLMIARNTIRGAGNNGIQILRWQNGDDGTIIVDNRIEDIANRSVGSGQFGNAINAHRANNVIVRGNRIRNCAFSGVRGNTASNIQIIGNTITDVREVALYSEFSFEGAIIANNIVDVAAWGVSVANFNEGGRIAIVQGNIIRNLLPKRPPSTAPDDMGGVGLYVEADSVVSGNVVENAPTAGIMLGYGKYLRDVNITGNIVRNADVGIGVSVVSGSASTLIADNVLSNTPRGAIVGMEQDKLVTGDLTRARAERYPHLLINNNRAD